VTTRDPSGLNAAENTARSWPRRTAISFPVAAFQMRAVASRRPMKHDPNAVTMRRIIANPTPFKGLLFRGRLLGEFLYIDDVRFDREVPLEDARVFDFYHP
jgi:hypothetical protein